jgi:plasmid stabilization system protein ParE
MTGHDFHPEAVVDLDEIWDFIATDNLDAPDRLIAEILAALDKLVSFPKQGHKRPDLTSRPLRFTLIREYLIAIEHLSHVILKNRDDHLLITF